MTDLPTPTATAATVPTITVEHLGSHNAPRRWTFADNASQQHFAADVMRALARHGIEARYGGDERKRLKRALVLIDIGQPQDLLEAADIIGDVTLDCVTWCDAPVYEYVPNGLVALADIATGAAS